MDFAVVLAVIVLVVGIPAMRPDIPRASAVMKARYAIEIITLTSVGTEALLSSLSVVVAELPVVLVPVLVQE